MKFRRLPHFRPSSTDAFIKLHIDFAPAASELASDVWGAYCTWATAQTAERDSRWLFSRKLRHAGAQSPASHNAYRRWYGIRLVTPTSA